MELSFVLFFFSAKLASKHRRTTYARIHAAYNNKHSTMYLWLQFKNSRRTVEGHEQVVQYRGGFFFLNLNFWRHAPRILRFSAHDCVGLWCGKSTANVCVVYLNIFVRTLVCFLWRSVCVCAQRLTRVDLFLYAQCVVGFYSILFFCILTVMWVKIRIYKYLCFYYEQWTNSDVMMNRNICVRFDRELANKQSQQFYQCRFTKKSNDALSDALNTFMVFPRATTTQRLSRTHTAPIVSYCLYEWIIHARPAQRLSSISLL